MGLNRLGAVGLLLPLFVFGEVAFEEFNLALVLIVQDMGGDPVQEPAIVGDDHGAAGEFQQRVFQGTQGFDVQIVGGFVQQQHVAAGLQQLGQVQAPALATGEFANPLLLIGALEVETADIGAARELEVADLENVLAASHFIEYRLLTVHLVAELIHRRQLDGIAEDDLAAIGLLLAGQQPEQGGFTGTVRTNDADDGALGNGKGEIVDQHPIAIALAQVRHFHHLVAEAPAE